MSPILKRLPKAVSLTLKPGDYLGSLVLTHDHLQANSYDAILCVGDRIEMTAAAFAAFHNNVPIIHYFAGVKNIITTLDDINRHCITLWSDMQLVESKRCKRNVKKLCKNINKKANCHVVGITHLDDLILDYSKVPETPYNLILYNPTTKQDERVVYIGANEDDEWYKNLPRSQFLGLLSRANKFYSNSSAVVYEAPYFLGKSHIITIGKRNKKRTKLRKLKRGAQNIAEICDSDSREVLFEKIPR